MLSRDDWGGGGGGNEEEWEGGRTRKGKERKQQRKKRESYAQKLRLKLTNNERCRYTDSFAPLTIISVC